MPQPTFSDVPAFPRTMPLSKWLELRGVSRWTAYRLEKAGKLKLTQLSPGLFGVREDHDREYLESCLRPEV
jgi:predicted site-specific integrase-resolvase